MTNKNLQLKFLYNFKKINTCLKKLVLIDMREYFTIIIYILICSYGCVIDHTNEIESVTRLNGKSDQIVIDITWRFITDKVEI